MKNLLGLEVKAIVGKDIIETAKDAMELCRCLGLGYIEFETNGETYVAYSHRVVKWSSGNIKGRWEMGEFDTDWTYFPPLTSEDMGREKGI